MIAVSIEQPSESDIDVIHAVLTETYWSPGIPRDILARAIKNSLCSIARDEHKKVIGFARVVSDRATFAWLADVYVLDEHQGRGVARSLVRALQTHPDLQNLRRWLLGTRDAHGVYAPLGFSPLEMPERYMQIRSAAPYGRVAG